MGRYKGDLSWLTARPIAHRGYHDMNHTVWENTLSAFDRAIEKNFAIECDLQLACDGVPVVFHDDDLSRLCGLKDDVRLLTSRELAMKRIGGTGDAIPSLRAMLDRVAGRVPIIFELKGRKDEDDGFAGTVLEELENYDGKVAIMSFDTWLLEELVELDCPFPVGLTADGVREEKFAEHEKAMAMGLDFVSYGILHMPNRFVTDIRKSGTPVITWTVRTPDMRQRSDNEADQMTFEGFAPDAA